jgi:hypothetical protein
MFADFKKENACDVVVLKDKAQMGSIFGRIFQGLTLLFPCLLFGALSCKKNNRIINLRYMEVLVATKRKSFRPPSPRLTYLLIGAITAQTTHAK